jgi:hypothetical protein
MTFEAFRNAVSTDKFFLPDKTAGRIGTAAGWLKGMILAVFAVASMMISFEAFASLLCISWGLMLIRSAAAENEDYGLKS